ncbi:MAG: 50S ribosomal protein L9 [Coxiella sp. RIFCSPHIGHO2_12_FULL_42_15]|nr:MAG: 50S ribosomal protein L9 [Coxiella sp. RIFCSPHIGHO2_12_FULL_42_15]
MRLILKENVSNLGNIGEVVTVKPGFGRNFLIPYGKAVRATEENIKAVEKLRAELEKKEAEKLASAQQRAEKLQQLTITIAAKASEEGKLFGSIGAREIVEAVEKAHLELHKNEVKLPNGPLRQTGEHEVDLFLHTSVTITVKVIVEVEA